MLRKRHIVVHEDLCYAASWSLEDEADVRKDFLRMRNDTLNPETFNQRLERFYNDQTVWIDKNRKYLEPLKVGKKIDKIVVEGLIRIAEYASGKSSKLFTVQAIGTGSTSVSAKDFQLAAEVTRLSMLENDGYLSSRGSTNFWGMIWPKTVQTIQTPPIKEVGIVDDMDLTIDQMLLRTVLPNGEEIEHVVNQDVFSFNHVVYNYSV